MSLKTESVPLQFYPARPTNWPNSRNVLPAKCWASEPKINGWRIIIDTELRQVWNRHGKIFSHADKVLDILSPLLATWNASRFLDGEFLGLRTKFGKDCVVLFDSMDLNDSTSYEIRKTRLMDAIGESPLQMFDWNKGLSPISYLPDCLPSGISCSAVSKWMEGFNKEVGEDFFEGWVFKDRGAYPWQRTATAHSAQWIKDRYIVPRGDGL
jgi:hypothetical protein